MSLSPNELIKTNPKNTIKAKKTRRCFVKIVADFMNPYLQGTGMDIKKSVVSRIC